MSETIHDVLGEPAPTDDELRGIAADEPSAPAPAPRAEAPEPTAEAPEADPAPKQQADTRVPLAALREERERRQRSEAEAKEAREMAAAATRQFQELMATLKPKPDAPKVPNRDEDPVAYLEHQIAERAAEAADFKAWKEQQTQQSQRQQQDQAFAEHYRNAAEAFAEKQPDFGNAYAHVVESLKADYREAGYSEPEVVALLHQQERQIVNMAARDGVNPAERLYKLAVRRGYAKAEPAADEETRIEAIARGQAASRSLGAAPASRAAGGELTISALANMAEDEFMRIPKEKRDRIYRRGV